VADETNWRTVMVKLLTFAAIVLLAFGAANADLVANGSGLATDSALSVSLADFQFTPANPAFGSVESWGSDTYYWAGSEQRGHDEGGSSNPGTGGHDQWWGSQSESGDHSWWSTEPGSGDHDWWGPKNPHEPGYPWGWYGRHGRQGVGVSTPLPSAALFLGPALAALAALRRKRTP